MLVLRFTLERRRVEQRKQVRESGVPIAGSILRLIDSCITQLEAQGPSRTCNESKEEAYPSGTARARSRTSRFSLRGRPSCSPRPPSRRSLGFTPACYRFADWVRFTRARTEKVDWVSRPRSKRPDRIYWPQRASARSRASMDARRQPRARPSAGTSDAQSAQIGRPVAPGIES